MSIKRLRNSLLAASLTGVLLFVLPSAMASHHGNDDHHNDHEDHHHGAPAEAADNPAVRAYMEANERMHQGMAIDFTGDADVDFVKGMIPHHEGAIDMARVVLEHGEDEAIRSLAEEIIEAQEEEIEQMKAWLRERGHAVD